MFRFTIRELALLTAVVALAVGWWVDRSRLAAESEIRHQRIYELTMEVKQRYPRVSEMYPPWRDPFEVPASEKH